MEVTVKLINMNKVHGIQYIFDQPLLTGAHVEVHNFVIEGLRETFRKLTDSFTEGQTYLKYEGVYEVN
jgi:hypothetical protein